MTDEFVNELLTKLEILESEKASHESLVQKLQADLISSQQKTERLEKEVVDLSSQNSNLRALLKTKITSQDSVPEELK